MLDQFSLAPPISLHVDTSEMDKVHMLHHAASNASL